MVSNRGTFRCNYWWCERPCGCEFFWNPRRSVHFVFLFFSSMSPCVWWLSWYPCQQELTLLHLWKRKTSYWYILSPGSTGMPITYLESSLCTGSLWPHGSLEITTSLYKRRSPWQHPRFVHTTLCWWWSLKYPDIFKENSQMLSCTWHSYQLNTFLSVGHHPEMSILWSRRSSMTKPWIDVKISGWISSRYKGHFGSCSLWQAATLFLEPEDVETKNLEQVSSTWSGSPPTTLRQMGRPTFHLI